MDLGPVDASCLPLLLFLLLVLGCFRPMLRRAGPDAGLWFAGWALLLVHLGIRLAQSLLPSRASGHPLSVSGEWTLTLCLVLLLLAAERRASHRVSGPVAASLAIPMLLASVIAAFPLHPLGVDRLEVLLFAAPAIYLLLVSRAKTLQTNLLGATCVLLTVVALIAGPERQTITLDAAFSLLLLDASWLFVRSAANLGLGTLVAAAGFAGWGFSIPAPALCHLLWPQLLLPGAVYDLPVFAVVAGILQTLLEDQVAGIERLAMHDPLTDLPNRRMFEARLSEALEEARAQRTTVACLVIDIDNFKCINDSLGHAAGDQILRALAVRLSWNLSPRDLLARTGGDEYTALLAGVHDEHHLEFVASAMMSAASVPIIVDDVPVAIRISTGIAFSSGQSSDLDGLRRAADDAMYSAKRRGGSLLAYAGRD